MSYQEIAPSQLLHSLIQCYWVMEGSHLKEEYHHTVLPDGCFDIIIDIQNTLENTLILTGIWDKAITVSIGNTHTTVGVRFYPTAIDAFFNCNVANYKNTRTPFEPTMLKIRDVLSLMPLYTLKYSEELVDFLDCYFVLLYMYTPIENTILLHGQQEESIRNVSDFAIETGISTRQLNRHYQSRFGISPKTYLSILRFIKAKAYLLSSSPMSLAQIATESGYYDQAHFIKEFKRFSGQTPATFININKVSDFYNTDSR